VLITGSYRVAGIDVETGKAVWWYDKLTWQLKPTPAMDVEKQRVFVLGWAGGSDEGNQEEVGTFAEALKKLDGNKDGRISKEEIGDPKLTSDWRQMDLDNDGTMGERDWQMYANRRKAVNALWAFKLGGSGDMTEKGVLWRHTKSLPNVPSPLYYRGVVYLMKEGGILTALDADTGKVTKQARLQGALDPYFASPVASDGRVYVVSQTGRMVILKAGAEWEVMQVNDLDDEVYATPALADGRIYVRTRSALYAFAN
jgi:outer membrane protein assembly factor BamB